MKRPFLLTVAVALALCLVEACAFVAKTVSDGGERPLNRPVVTVAKAPSAVGSRVIVFCLDGAGYPQLMEAIRSGKAPHIAALLGKERGNGVFEHGYSAPGALSVLPSSTVADWAATFTGQPPAQNGVPGDEWFDRQHQRFYAPVPITVTGTADFSAMLDDDLVGKQLKVPTLYEQLKRRSYVSMLMIYRGATLFSTVPPSTFAGVVGSLVEGKLSGETALEAISKSLDLASTTKLLQAIDEHGLPRLQVVYFPGIDLFTHASPNPLHAQVGYIEDYTDQAVGQVLDAYRKRGALSNTFVIFVADHGHTPTMNDDRHRLGPDDPGSPFAILKAAGFRVRKASLTLSQSEQDYQAVIASQGFMAYVYLADRSTCRAAGQACDWSRPPRFRQDTMSAVRALYAENQSGRPIPQGKGTVDLIFAREPAEQDEEAGPFKVFDGRRLVPIRRYLEKNPRPDLVDLEERMRWLGDGPYGGRAGDIVILAKASSTIPIQDRYYFAATTHYSWHGSPDISDSNVPFILALDGGSGTVMRDIVNNVSHGETLSEMDVTPLVLALIGH
ncbi:MAG TPA: alkaline phosphatase family protein [Candidatus Binataceae bacterium]|nr:alkaline phosphatase family protein [Candidatus Binataceae bacterium]